MRSQVGDSGQNILNAAIQKVSVKHSGQVRTLCFTVCYVR